MSTAYKSCSRAGPGGEGLGAGGPGMGLPSLPGCLFRCIGRGFLSGAKTPPANFVNTLIHSAQAAGSSSCGHCPDLGHRAMPSAGHRWGKHEPAPRTAAKSFLGS